MECRAVIKVEISFKQGMESFGDDSGQELRGEHARTYTKSSKIVLEDARLKENIS